MTTPPTPPLLDYGRPVRREISYVALAAPFVAVGAFVLAGFLGTYFVGRHPILAYVSIAVCSLGSIAFGVFATMRVRRSRGRLLGTSSAALAMFFSMCSGLLCPGFAGSLEASRHLSNSAYTMARMREIVQGCRAYAGSHDEHFPPHLAVLLETHVILPKQLLDKNASIELEAFPEARLAGGMDWRSIAAEVDAHCDFAYVGADVDDDGDSDVIVLYTKPGRIHKHLSSHDTWDGQGRLVTYADGHTELVLDADLAGAFKRSNAARAKLGLPAVALDGPVPAGR